MTLIKALIKKDKISYFSYENLMGNYKDGEIGTKIVNQIIGEFLERNNPDKDFQEEFYR